MAYRGHKVVAVTPAGRERVMSILLDNLSRFRHIIDEYQVWFNADEDQVEDRKWLRSLPETYDWVRLVELKGKRLKPKQMNTGKFYTNTIDEDTIYIRFDDDIVYIDDNFFYNILDFRIDNPDYFLVFANIWNNAILSYIHQQIGNIPDQPVVKDAYCMDPVAWESGSFAESIHEILIEHIENDTTSELFFGKTELIDAKRFSISCFAFFGKDFAKFDGIVGYKDGELLYDEEIWLTEVHTVTEDLLSVICGSALVAHYSFFSQRPYLDKTDILEEYKRIGRSKLSESYYDQLKGGADHDKPTGLEDFELPPSKEPDSDVIIAIKAQKAGFEAVVGPDKTQITLKGRVVGERVGPPNGLKTDRLMSRLYRKMS